MEIFIEKTGKTQKIEYKGKLSKLLSQLKINEEMVICVADSSVVLGSQDISRVKKLKLLSVVSGG